jgi:hypothetical protein
MMVFMQLRSVLDAIRVRAPATAVWAAGLVGSALVLLIIVRLIMDASSWHTVIAVAVIATFFIWIVGWIALALLVRLVFARLTVGHPRPASSARPVRTPWPGGQARN